MGGIEVEGAVSHRRVAPDDPEERSIRVGRIRERLLLLFHAANCPREDGTCEVAPGWCGKTKKLWEHMATCSDDDCGEPHCFSSRSALDHYRRCGDPRCPACGPVLGVEVGVGSNCAPGDSMRGGPQAQRTDMNTFGSESQKPISKPMDGMVNSNGMYCRVITEENNKMSTAGGTPELQAGCEGRGSKKNIQGVSDVSEHGSEASSGGSSNAEEYQKKPGPEVHIKAWVKARHVSHRLLLLLHASKCTSEEGRCAVTPNCAAMKRLWKHILRCDDPDCGDPDCLSSRVLMSHYRGCPAPACVICDPVRKSVRCRGGIGADAGADGPALAEEERFTVVGVPGGGTSWSLSLFELPPTSPPNKRRRQDLCLCCL